MKLKSFQSLIPNYKAQIMNNDIFKKARLYLEKYSTISTSNHLIVAMMLILVSNWIMVSLNLSVYYLLITLGIILFLSLIRGNLKAYDIELNNNGQVTQYYNVKYKYLKKKDHLVIYHSDGRTTLIKQGNYSIKERVNSTPSE
ncbi:hypothetical protein C1631_022985 [Chryseobacterium phosphatilyticum]|uniref:Uncharacterized protein n=2 Tax=Chryseobacterium phosphatilyticum TaxID=475075 RepID=A0A316WPW2_9FLAO|nr:hypothetical protein C1631_022985 [Chryseobacterium phosphatilyticum]